MDELAKIIHASIWSGNGQSRTSLDACLDHANAVRTYLESEKVVDRLALFLFARDADDQSYVANGWQDASPFERELMHETARAALNAAGGKQDA